MKVLLLNGSPRKGNTHTAVELIAQGIKENLKAEVEVIEVAKYKVAGCVACDYCVTNVGKCVNQKDDGQLLADKIAEADVVVFASPIYWWGISAQIKLVLDRIYMKKFEREKKYKQVGIIAIGADGLEDEEYELISRQFKCICNFIGWDLVIDKGYSAYEKDDLLKNELAVKELKELLKNIK